MTAQVPEVLLYDNQTLSMCTVPLLDYFYLTKNEPKFRVNCTALWRGYIGTWEIVEDRLYLIAIDDAHFEDGKKVTLETLFPGFTNRVFAHWYTGKIRAPKGELINYVHGGFDSTYEQDLIFQIKKGLIIKVEITNNKVDLDDMEDIF